MHSTVQLLAPIPSISHDGFIFVRKNIVEIMRSARYNKCVIDFLLQKKGREKPYHQNRLCRHYCNQSLVWLECPIYINKDR